MKINWPAVLFAGLVCSGCSTLHSTNPATAYGNEIVLNDSQLEGLARAEATNGTGYSYAVSQSGHWGYIGGVGSRSMRAALSICQHYANQPCRVHSSGASFTQSQYTQYSAESLAALRSLKDVTDKNYHDEATDWKILAPPLARPAMKNMNGPTPLALPGIRTIRTAELVALIKKTHPVIIDAEGYVEDLKTIPNAFLIDWIGVPKMSENEEVAVFNRLDMVMRSVEKDIMRPVVVFCESSSCWLSACAALRLRELGYNNVLWYRGGKNAWKEAGLPLVKAVPYATLWDHDISWPNQ
jgi:PQQ-dependent catabolism-associated CXXCW motif protein